MGSFPYHKLYSAKAVYEFHVAKNLRLKYQFDKSLFSINGDLIIANFRLARELSNKINEKRKSEGKNDHLITAGLINAVGLMHEIFHFLIRWYEEKENPGVLKRTLNSLYQHLGEKELDQVFLKYVEEFPPLDVHLGKITAEDYLSSSTNDKPNNEIVLEELILLQLENINPAGKLLEEFYSDKNISEKTKYIELLDEAENYLTTEKTLGSEKLPLIQFLRKPIITNPHNLEGQLDYILTKWGVYVHDVFRKRILSGKDLIQEDIKLFIQHGGGEKGTPPVPDFKQLKDYYEYLKSKLKSGAELSDYESAFYHSEYEKFTLDTDWMPKVVMIAKNSYVWLDQLSKKYRRHIHRLDQIPDEELDRLASWNFTALWFIGIWERSSASKKIKHITGNVEAISSAYSLYDYVIANELGGEEAFQNLKERAWKRGIRIASDMVPNHTGIYSKWVVEKPDYFIQTSYPPFPGYSFTGPNLSDDDRVEIRIEDKYYSRQDAAVVFQRRDRYTGDVRYIYHGNDGTHMPWNDTAQLNLLIPEVRESLIQTIMHVARKFPIIRFDAAMTLAKKHYQRLWFPVPGTGGAIPSRSDFAMSRQDFDKAMPNEFWRELVDRINSEMPNTLLLAEAFWLMEGYFVRTLGMHRVYNSAFMHMLMKEENDKYHDLIKNTLDFNPEILKRYVNFMSNPDEETAVNQFGKGDKYFGIAMLMVTLPGLPMFGHGQIEGFAEKYGMEYKRAYYDENVDEYLVHRHEQEIFPLMKKRYLFAQVADFEFFEFIDEFGNINFNVFAFTNRFGNEKAFVIFNNAYAECKGTINYSVPKSVTVKDGSKYLAKTKLGDALQLKYDYKFFYICRDHKTNLEHLFSGKDILDHGFFLHLQGYQYKVFMDFREVYDTNGIYEKLYHWLQGRGVPSIENAIKEHKLIPVNRVFDELFSEQIFNEVNSFCFESEKSKRKSLTPANALTKTENLIAEINRIENIPLSKEEIIKKLKDDLLGVKYFSTNWNKALQETKTRKSLAEINNSLTIFNSNAVQNRQVLFILNFIKHLNGANSHKHDNENLFDRLWIGKKLSGLFDTFHFSHDIKERNIGLIRCLSFHSELLNLELDGKKNKKVRSQKEKISAKGRSVAQGKNDKTEFNFEAVILNQIFESYLIRDYLNYNEYDGIFYYSKERFENLMDWLFTLNTISFAAKLLANESLFKKKTVKKRKSVYKDEDKDEDEDKDNDKDEDLRKRILSQIKKNYEFFNNFKKASDEAGYKVEDLIKSFENKN
jgi:glycosidase